MDEITLWETDRSWPRLWTHGGILLVHDFRWESPSNLARAFDARSLEPLGPACVVDEVLCLGTVPEYRGRARVRRSWS